MQPVQIPGVVVQLHQDSLLAPQLVVTNRSGKLLEVLDDDGRAFLRFGKDKVEGDGAATEFHRARISGGASAPKGTLSRMPRWHALNREPSYGWFDSRIATGPIEIPYAVLALGREMPFGEWEIPLRLDGEKQRLRGHFVYTPPPRGAIRSRLSGPSTLAPGIEVQLAPGSVPALMLSNRSAQTVTVLDRRGQPLLRLAPTGTTANLDSPDWPLAGAGQAVSGRGWQSVSKSRSHVWLEARARYTGPRPEATQVQRLNDWSVPLLIGERRIELRGYNEWLPAAAIPSRK